MGKVVQVASREALLSLDAIYGLAAFLNTLDVPRRKVLDWLADVLFAWIEDGGLIIDDNGDEIVIEAETIDDAHGDDSSSEWISATRRRVANPPQRRSRPSMGMRLALYDAACRITTGKSIIDFGED